MTSAPIYFKEIQEVSNYITTFAIAQNIGATFTFLTSDPIKVYLKRANALILYCSILGGGLFYSLAILYCWQLESNLSYDSNLRSTGLGLCRVRIVVIILTIVPLFLSAVAVRKHLSYVEKLKYKLHRRQKDALGNPSRLTKMIRSKRA